MAHFASYPDETLMGPSSPQRLLPVHTFLLLQLCFSWGSAALVLTTGFEPLLFE